MGNGQPTDSERRDTRVVVLGMIAFLIVSAWSTATYAQVAPGGTVTVVDQEALGGIGGRMNLAPNFEPTTRWPANRARQRARPAMRSDQPPQAPTSPRLGTRARSKTRTVVGAIVGGVGGFFAGGFLGAHIEGDRCNCDDPGVRGFVIGAPIGAVTGGIVGGKFLF